MCRRIGDQSGEASALRGLAADGAFALARYAEAEAQYQEALEVFRRIGDQRGEAYALRGLAETARDLARYAEAEAQYQEALEVFRRIGDQSGEAYALLGLAQTALALARYDQCKEQMAACVQIVRPLHIPATALSWSVYLGLRLVAAAEAHRAAGKSGLAGQALVVARQCHTWAGAFAADPDLPEASRDNVQRYHALGRAIGSILKPDRFQKTWLVWKTDERDHDGLHTTHRTGDCPAAALCRKGQRWCTGTGGRSLDRNGKTSAGQVTQSFPHGEKRRSRADSGPV